MASTTLPEIYRPMMEGVTVKAGHCLVCGRVWPLNDHHVVWRSWGEVIDEKGKKAKIRARVVLVNKKAKMLGHTKKLRYRSGDPKIAQVTKKGVIKARKAGRCNVYVFSENGVWKRIRVIVKK